MSKVCLRAVVITHKSGESVYVCEDDAAQDVLKEWVRTWWTEEMDGPLPDPLTEEDMEDYWDHTGESGFVQTINRIEKKGDIEI